MSHIFLFDIDQTLIRTSGVGTAAMNITLERLIGVPDAFARVDFKGRTDRAIIRDALVEHGGVPDDLEDFITAFEAAYAPVIEEQMQRRGGVVLPGVREMLEAVAALPGVRLGVATGNFRRAALTKLRYFELDRYFAAGGFADDAEDRAVLVRMAIDRLGGRRGNGEVFVLGDTVHDISAARAADGVAVGVATGSATMETLAAAGAHHVFDDLSRPGDVLARLLGAAA